MKLIASVSILSLIILLPALAQGTFLGISGLEANSMLNATSTSLPAILEVWSPDVHSSNITSTTLFPVGGQFTARVNVTNAGPIAGFDVFLNYNLTFGPDVIQAVKTGDELSGGLFDPSSQPSGCSVLVIKSEVNLPPGRLRFAAILQGGCAASGTGTLFKILFQVIGNGADFINIVRTTSLGQTATTIVGPAPLAQVIPFQPLDGRFQNVPGTPPIARFSYGPAYPIKGDLVHFVGSQSYDPDNSTIIGNGIRRYLWLLGDGALLEGANQTHIFVFPILIPASGNFSVTLIVWDFANLPGDITQIVSVSPGIGQAGSFNWSGYAVSSSPGSITDVRGSWIVPGIIESCGTTDKYASIWVGIDGFNSPSVEQTGTDSACIGGVKSYYSWYELYPHSAHVINPMKINPGDTIFAEVTFSSGKFNLTIADLSNGGHFSKMASVKAAQRSSAEWIAEAPSSKTGIVPLANFGTVKFGQDYTGVPNSCFATLSGTSGPLGSFGSRIQEITMVSPSFAIKATTTAFSPDLTSFAVNWTSAGP